MDDSPVEYIKKVYEKWKRCPICGSEDGFEVKRYFLVKCRLVCKACSAEWVPNIEKGEINGMTLLKSDLDGKAAQDEFSTHPLEWWAGMEERIRIREEKGNQCPFCGSEKIEIKWKAVQPRKGIGEIPDIIVCTACLAELKFCFKDGVSQLTLIKPDLAGRATRYLSQTLPLDEWIKLNLAGEKVTESKKELIPKIERVEESKEELIAKLDKRLINGEIREETYKQILDRIKSMSEAKKSKERGMEPKTEVE